MPPRIATEVIDGLRLDHARPDEPTGEPPVLYVHGMWGGSWVFEHWLRFTAERGRAAWALNLRGHHGSRPVPALTAVGIEEYVDDVVDALEAIGPVVVVGHSMGGLLAQLVASRPDVIAAVLIASVPPPGLRLLTWGLMRRTPRYLAQLLRAHAFRVRHADVRALALNVIPPASQTALADRFVEDSGRVAWQIALGRLPAPTPIACPMLVIGAGRDRLTPVRLQRRIARRYGADYFEATAHGHMLPVEPGWQLPLARVLAWLASRTTAPTAIGLTDGVTKKTNEIHRHAISLT